MIGRIAGLVPMLFSLCAGLLLSVLGWYQWRAYRHSDDHSLGGTTDERLLEWLLWLGAAMLGLFVFYALFGIPY
jgi:nicotinamide riboside transporter PnuC